MGTQLVIKSAATNVSTTRTIKPWRFAVFSNWAWSLYADTVSIIPLLSLAALKLRYKMSLPFREAGSPSWNSNHTVFLSLLGAFFLVTLYQL